MELSERILEAAIMNELARDKVPVTITLINGTEFQGVVARYDVLVVVLATEGKQQFGPGAGAVTIVSVKEV